MLIRISNRCITHIWFYLFVLVLLDFSASPSLTCLHSSSALTEVLHSSEPFCCHLLFPSSFSLLNSAAPSLPWAALLIDSFLIPTYSLHSGVFAPHSSQALVMWCPIPTSILCLGPWSCSQPHCFSLTGLFCLDLWPEQPSSQPGVIHVLLAQRVFPLFPASLHQCLPLYGRSIHWGCDDKTRVNGSAAGCCSRAGSQKLLILGRLLWWVWNIPHRLTCWLLVGGTVLEGCRNCRRGDLAGGSR